MPILILLILFSATFLNPEAVQLQLEEKSAIHPAEGETIVLSYRPAELRVDQGAEQELLRLVNVERRRAGLEELAYDEEIAAVARAHSFDMWDRQYFAHENLDGDTLVDRMKEGEVAFGMAGENLALTKSVERAHEGLMNSPGHRRNILDPDFKRIGIGVVDGGVYGKMFTQNFAD